MLAINALLRFEEESREREREREREFIEFFVALVSFCSLKEKTDFILAVLFFFNQKYEVFFYKICYRSKQAKPYSEL